MDGEAVPSSSLREWRPGLAHWDGIELGARGSAREHELEKCSGPGHMPVSMATRIVERDSTAVFPSVPLQCLFFWVNLSLPWVILAQFFFSFLSDFVKF